MTETLSQTSCPDITSGQAGLIISLLICSVAVLAVPAGIYLLHRIQAGVRGKRPRPIKLVLTTTLLMLLAVWSLRFAVGYYVILSSREPNKLCWYEEIFNSIIHALQTVSMDEDYTDYIVNGKAMIAALFGADSPGITAYGIYASVLNFLAPVFGGAFLFDVLTRFFPVVHLWFCDRTPWRTKYYFSELNERSAALAKTLSERPANPDGERWHRPVIVFTDAYPDAESEENAALLEEAKAIGAICLKQDLLHILRRGSKKKEYLLIDDCELNNIRTLAQMADPEHCKMLRQTTVRVFYQNEAYLLTELRIIELLRKNLGEKFCPAIRRQERALRRSLLDETEQLLSRQAEAAFRRGGAVFAEPSAEQPAAENDVPLNAETAGELAAAALPKSAEAALRFYLDPETAGQAAECWEKAHRTGKPFRLPRAVRQEILTKSPEDVQSSGYSFAAAANAKAAQIAPYQAFLDAYEQTDRSAVTAADIPFLRRAAQTAQQWHPLCIRPEDILLNAFYTEKGEKKDNDDVLKSAKDALTERILPAVDRIRCYQHMVLDLLQELPLYQPLLDAPGSRSLDLAVIGLGEIGREMLLSAFWCGQMLRTPLSINLVSLESKEEAADTISYLAPEMLRSAEPDTPMLRVFAEGEERNPRYCTLRFASANLMQSMPDGVICEPLTAAQKAESIALPDCNYFFVAAGSDERNIRIAEEINRAVAVRKKKGLHPGKVIITYVVYDSDLCRALNDPAVLTEKNLILHPDIRLRAVGDLETLYSRQNIFMERYTKIAADIGRKYRERVRDTALKRTRVRTKRTYDSFSSTARAVHLPYKMFSAAAYCEAPENLRGLSEQARQKVQQQCETVKAYLRDGKNAQEAVEAYRCLYDAAKWSEHDADVQELCGRIRGSLAGLEHRRWVAYMRSIGFTAAEEPEGKNILLKRHPMMTETVLPYADADPAHPRGTDRLEAVYLAQYMSAGRKPLDFTDYKSFDYPNNDNLG